MSTRRWTSTAAVMAGIAWALAALTPDPGQLRAAAADPQRFVDTTGADSLVLLVVPVLAWLCWAWGALGLLLTAASTVPGGAGRLAGLLAAGVLPVGARRAAALALGIGLSTAAPVLLPPAAPLAVVTAAADDGVNVPPVLDWPGAPGSPAAPPAVPDWPSPSADDHVVLRGDCLWDIAADWLRTRHADPPPSDTEIARAVEAWWHANAEVIGPDLDLLLPGQVLRPPG